MKSKQILKVVAWTAGVGAAVFLVLDGKTTTPNAGEHLLLGAVLGLGIGLFSVWKQRNSS